MLHFTRNYEASDILNTELEMLRKAQCPWIQAYALLPDSNAEQYLLRIVIHWPFPTKFYDVMPPLTTSLYDIDRFLLQVSPDRIHLLEWTEIKCDLPKKEENEEEQQRKMRYQ